jgi:site-specific DNA-methyltransferase (adenine-specific)
VEWGKVDAIITDLPYGTTACKWDNVIPFEPMWAKVREVLKPKGAFVTTASQPFTSALVMSNLKWFKYSLVWNKKFAGNFNNAKYMPMITFEDIVVFGNGKTTYNPQMTKRDVPIKGGGFTASQSIQQKTLIPLKKTYNEKYPVAILDFPRALGKSGHPTQKPVALYEYLIKTYTNEGDTVLDICMGSGTTGVACKNTGRNFIGIEMDAEYFKIAEARIDNP